MAKPERILVLDGHPDDDSLCRSLGAAYERGAIEGGAQVRRTVVAHLEFDPILHHGFRKRTELEKDLVQAQQDILWAEHVVVVLPIWWSDMPALLKGFVDRVFLPGFAFKYREKGLLWDKFLKGRSARIVYTQDAPDWYYRFLVGRPVVRILKKGVLEFCGVGPVGVTAFGPVKSSTPQTRGKWIGQLEAMGRARR